jgi:hypothetical protein
MWFKTLNLPDGLNNDYLIEAIQRMSKSGDFVIKEVGNRLVALESKEITLEVVQKLFDTLESRIECGSPPVTDVHQAMTCIFKHEELQSQLHIEDVQAHVADIQFSKTGKGPMLPIDDNVRRLLLVYVSKMVDLQVKAFDKTITGGDRVPNHLMRETIFKHDMFSSYDFTNVCRKCFSTKFLQRDCGCEMCETSKISSNLKQSNQNSTKYNTDTHSSSVSTSPNMSKSKHDCINGNRRVHKWASIYNTSLVLGMNDYLSNDEVLIDSGANVALILRESQPGLLRNVDVNFPQTSVAGVGGTMSVKERGFLNVSGFNLPVLVCSGVPKQILSPQSLSCIIGGSFKGDTEKFVQHDASGEVLYSCSRRNSDGMFYTSLSDLVSKLKNLSTPKKVKTKKKKKWSKVAKKAFVSQDTGKSVESDSVSSGSSSEDEATNVHGLSDSDEEDELHQVNQETSDSNAVRYQDRKASEARQAQYYFAANGETLKAIALSPANRNLSVTVRDIERSTSLHTEPMLAMQLVKAQKQYTKAESTTKVTKCGQVICCDFKPLRGNGHLLLGFDKYSGFSRYAHCHSLDNQSILKCFEDLIAQFNSLGRTSNSTAKVNKIYMDADPRVSNSSLVVEDVRKLLMASKSVEIVVMSPEHHQPFAESHIRRVDEAVAMINATLEFDNSNIPSGEIEIYHHVLTVRNHKPSKKEGVEAPITDTPYHAYTGKSRSFRNHKLIPYGSVVTVLRTKSQMRKAKITTAHPTRGEYGIVLGPADLDGPSRRVFLFSSQKVNHRRVCDRVQSVQARHVLPPQWLKTNTVDVNTAQLSQKEMDKEYIATLKAENNLLTSELGVIVQHQGEDKSVRFQDEESPSSAEQPEHISEIRPLADNTSFSSVSTSTKDVTVTNDHEKDFESEVTDQSSVRGVAGNPLTMSVLDPPTEETNPIRLRVGDKIEAPYLNSRRRFAAIVTHVNEDTIQCNYYSFKEVGIDIPIDQCILTHKVEQWAPQFHGASQRLRSVLLATTWRSRHPEKGTALSLYHHDLGEAQKEVDENADAQANLDPEVFQASDDTRELLQFMTEEFQVNFAQTENSPHNELVEKAYQHFDANFAQHDILERDELDPARALDRGEAGSTTLNSLQSQSFKPGLFDSIRPGLLESEIKFIIVPKLQGGAMMLTQSSTYDLEVPEEECQAWITLHQMSGKKALSVKDPAQAIKALNIEMDGLQHLGVFSPVSWENIPDEYKSQVMKAFVFVVKKYNAKMEYEKDKARVVMDGSSQPGSSFKDTSSRTMNPSTTKLLFLLAAWRDWNVSSTDIKQAFCLVDQIEPVYVRLPAELWPRFGKYVRLLKCLYGLRQAAYRFYEEIRGALIKAGFEVCTHDPALFRYYQNEELVLLVGVHVDDTLVIAKTPEHRDILVKALSDRFTEEHVKVELKPESFLGLEVRYNEDKSIHLSQSGYIQSVLDRFKEDATPVPNKQISPHTPDSMKVDMQDEYLEPLNPKNNRYPELVGCLGYAVHTQPGITPTLGFLQSRQRAPSKGDYLRAIQVLHYLYQVRDSGITFRGPDDPDASNEEIAARGRMRASCDASYNTHTDGKGHGGWIIGLGECEPALCTYGGKQTIMGRSSTNAEYITYGDVVAHVEWFREIVEFAGQPQTEAVVIENDNAAALNIANLPWPTKGVRHIISPHVHYFKDAIRRDRVRFVYRNTDDLESDLMTKPLVGAKFMKHNRRVREGIKYKDRPLLPPQPKIVMKSGLPEHLMAVQAA